MAENNEEGAFSTQATGGNGIRSRRASRRLRRESHDYDIDGNPLEGDGARTQAVFVRSTSESKAMGYAERMRNRVENIFNRVILRRNSELDLQSLASDEEEGKGKQYRLAATRRGKRTLYSRFCKFCCGVSEPGSTFGLDPQKNLAMWLHWMFRVNFLFLFCLSCVVFFALTFFFAAFIIWAGNADPECVRIGGDPFGTAKFADAFALSWTTFSTVGYGSTYPALGHENTNRTNCLFITVICSLESFIGVLYSGFCGAILFGKVLRIQSHAQVLFSDPIVIRYGSGVEGIGNEEEGEPKEENGEEKSRTSKIPCPVLEFRIVNRLFHEVGGEIMDATMNCVANIDADDADPSIRDASETAREASKQWTTDTIRSETSTGATSDHSASERGNKSNLFASLIPFRSSQGNTDHVSFDEDPSAKIVSKRIFSKLLIEASEHPFFKRVWLARHVLDETSPILTPRARKLIRRNGGHWPEKLNNYDGVRKSLQFNQILVSLNGVSNVSASDVYAQKIYDFVDISVGYQFVNILYRDEKDGSLKVDIDLINDVKEQNGGGGEDLL